MRRVPLIVMIAGCSGSAAAPKPAEPAAPSSETLWDRGTFVTLDHEQVLPDIEERFEIHRTDGGYRFDVTWKRPAPTGEPSDGEVTLATDDRFSPLQGTMTTTLRLAGRTEITKSSIRREPDGRLSTEVIAADGKTESAHSSKPNDWFIGGTITTFLVALCQADGSMTAPLVYPDKVTSLAPPEALVVEQRNVTSRTLTYEQSGRRVIVACEGGKLAGEVARGTTIVRSGDVALARVLEAAFQ